MASFTPSIEAVERRAFGDARACTSPIQSKDSGSSNGSRTRSHLNGELHAVNRGTYTDKGEALNEVADTNFDGKMDTWITFAKGRVAKLREDHNGDGQDDETRFYVGGQLSRSQIDTNYDSKPDIWEIYDDGR